METNLKETRDPHHFESVKNPRSPGCSQMFPRPHEATRSLPRCNVYAQLQGLLIPGSCKGVVCTDQNGRLLWILAKRKDFRKWNVNFLRLESLESWSAFDWFWIFTPYPWRIHGAAIYGNIYHQYTPVMLAFFYQHHGSVMGYGSINFSVSGSIGTGRSPHFNLNITLAGGLPSQLKNMTSSVGMMTFPAEWKNKIHVPNHQPELVWIPVVVTQQLGF